MSSSTQTFWSTPTTSATRRNVRRAKYRVTAAERKRRTRRLILMGSMVEARMKKSPATAAVIRKDLDEFLTRDQDRALFDLPGDQG